MRLDDRFMTVMTALVLIIAIGALVHGSGSGGSLFGGGGPYEAEDDKFTLRAGRVQALDVLLNDKNVDRIDPAQLTVVRQPDCGVAQSIDGTVQYSDSSRCQGALTFAYCVPFEDSCDFATVSLDILRISPSSADEQTPVASAPASRETGSSNTIVASTDAPAPAVFDTVQQGRAPQSLPQLAMRPVPSLAAPDTSEIITPAEAAENIRNRGAVAPVTDIQTAVNDTTQSITISNTSARSGTVSSSNVQMSQPGLGDTDSSITVASSNTSAPARRASPAQISLQSEEINVASTESAPDAQLAGPTQQTTVAAPERSGVIASIARSNTLIGATFSAARTLLEEPVETEVAALSQADAATAPNPARAAIASASELSTDVNVSIADDQEIALPLPSVERRLSTAPAPSGMQIAALGSDGFVRRTEAVPPRPQAGPAVTSDDIKVNELPITDGDPVDREEVEIVALPQADQPVLEIPVKAASDEDEVTVDVDSNKPNPELVGPILDDQNDEQVAALQSTTADVAVETAGAPAVCDVELALEVQPGANIIASLASPCRPNTPFTVTHETLGFTLVTDADGALTFPIPAFAKSADIAIEFIDGGKANGQIEVPDVSRFTRIAVSWSGSIDFDLHAFEFGAAKNTENHIWAGNPRDYRNARRSGGGYVQTFGTDLFDGGQKAEVYSLPRSARNPEGFIELSLSVADQADSCNSNVAVRTLRSEGSDTAIDRSIELSMGACGSENGNFIGEVIRDIRTARN